MTGEKNPVLSFNKAIIDATIDMVCAYKPNSAFYEARGVEGIDDLARTIEYIDGRVPVILDVKRGDIGNTARAYAKYCYEVMGADAVTLSPYMGYDSIEPFVEYESKAAFVLCLTSNPGANDFQTEGENSSLAHKVARKAVEWDAGKANIGLVVGATRGELVEKIRQSAGDLPFLIPGIGAQGGSLEVIEKAETATEGKPGVVVNSSRGIIYAGSGKDFAENARIAANDLRQKVAV